MSKNSHHSHEALAAPGRYDDALLSANWNPVIDLLHGSRSDSTRSTRRNRSDISEDEAKAFLGRVYAAGA